MKRNVCVEEPAINEDQLFKRFAHSASPHTDPYRSIDAGPFFPVENDLRFDNMFLQNVLKS